MYHFLSLCLQFILEQMFVNKEDFCLQCTNPILCRRFLNNDTGEIEYKILSRQSSLNVLKSSRDVLDLKSSVDGDSPSFLIPCGKCLACRLNYSKSWADRCMLELQYHDSAYFVTLTYDDNYLPFGDGDLPTLVPEAHKAFVKRLRSKLEYLGRPPIRFFSCGEYGGQTMRPHYHLIIFGLVLDDLVFYKLSPGTGEKLYNSKFLSDLWPYGYVVVGDVTYSTCAYVARYTAKKVNTMPAGFYEEKGIVRPFIRMSTKPGIGYQYMVDHPNLFDFNKINISTPDGGKSISIPKYFKKKRKESDYPSYKLASDRGIDTSLNSLSAALHSHGQSFARYCLNTDLNLKARTKSLRRNDF